MNGIRIWWRRVMGLGLGASLSAASSLGDDQVITRQVVLKLAGSQNRSVELAAERVREARALLGRDREQLFPWVSPGVAYRRHDGNLQDVVGNVFDASKQSGVAALTLQAQIDLGDSLYRVLASQQTVKGSEAGEAAQRRTTAMLAAAAYEELSRAAASLEAADEAVRIAEEFHRQVRQAVDSGLAFAGDAARAEVQVQRNQSLQLRTREELRLASVRLAELVRLPMTRELRPDLSEFVPLTLVATNRPLDSLVASALAHRPEMAQTRAQSLSAEALKSGTTVGPWIPTLGAQAAVGGLAGGRNGDFRNGDDFQDYGVAATWRIGPGGIGDRSRVRSAESRVRQAKIIEDQMRDAIMREVLEARARTDSAAAQLELAGRTLVASRRLLDLTHARRELGVGAVLEAVDAEREYTRARADQLRALADQNRLQWELWRAVGDGDLDASVAGPRR
jgi:outer membrane protein TolC